MSLFSNGVGQTPIDPELHALFMFMLDMLGGSITVNWLEIEKYQRDRRIFETYQNQATGSITFRIKE